MKQFKTIFLTSLITVTLTLTLIASYKLIPGESVENEKNDKSSKTLTQNSNDNQDAILISNKNLSNSRTTIITETVSNVSSAVVGINVTEIKTYRDPIYGLFGNDPFFQRYFGNRTYKQAVKSLGSGVIISEDGYIITNDHVAGNAVETIVTMTDGTQHPAKLIGTDHVSDVCLLKIESENPLPYVKLGNSDKIMIGEWVIALGNPFGLFQINDKPTVTVGVISSQNMNLGEVDQRYYINMLQTDAAINGGNSGGPLVNSIGELIGMNTLIYSPNGNSGSVGVGFAIPINKVEKIVNELKENGEVNRNFWTGLRIQTIDEGIAKYYDLATTKGVIVTYVAKKSPGEEADLQVGDIIFEANDIRVNDENTMIGILQDFHPGDKVNLKVLREGKISIKSIVLRKK